MEKISSPSDGVFKYHLYSTADFSDEDDDGEQKATKGASKRIVSTSVKAVRSKSTDHDKVEAESQLLVVGSVREPSDNRRRHGCDTYDDDRLESPPLWIMMFTYFSYALLFVVGYIHEKLRAFNLERNRNAQDLPQHKNFVPLYSSFEALYTTSVYVHLRDVLNRPIASVPGRQMTVVERTTPDNGWTFRYTGTTRTVLNLGSYNYLGFAENDGPTIPNVEHVIRNCGVSVASSRHEFGNLSIHRELEHLTAEFLGVEDAICFPMGFATNSMNIPCFADKTSLIISDELNHASLILGCRLSGATIKLFKHNDMKDLEKKLREAVVFGQSRTKRPYSKILIFVEGVYSMEGTILKLPEIIALKKKYKCYLYLDEAHSIGAIGKHGRGVCDYWGCDPNDVDILMGTFTKSFASIGGYIAGRKKVIDYVRLNSHSACYAPSMSPIICQQIIAVMKIIMGRDGTCDGADRIQRLSRNTRYFRSRLKQLGFIVGGEMNSPVVPLMIYLPSKFTMFSRELLKRNIGVVVVGFPATPILLGRARFCLSASHSKDDLDKALEEISEVGDLLCLKLSRRRYPKREIVY